MKKWREDAQPEWPEVASGAGGGSSPAGSKGDTQAFPATGETEVPDRGRRSRSETGTRQTEILRGGGRTTGDADETAILRVRPRGAVADADETAVLPAVGQAADVSRTGGQAADVRPSTGRSDGWSAFERPSRTPVVRDPWAEAQEPERTGHAEARPDAGATHDPHEVTIQLDGVGLQLDNMLRAAKDAPGGGEGSDGPVFVDESGRRSRLYRRIGMAVGLACAVYAVVIVATLLSGNSHAPWLPVERPKEQPAGQVDTPPLPAESAPQPSGTGSVSPGTSPTAGTDATASPGADATTPGASTSADPGASADPKPTPTKTTTNPGTNPTPDPEPTTEPTIPDPDPSPTDGGGPTEEPTDPATTGEPATGTVANGPNDPSPIAQEPDASAPAPAAPSPEYTL
ncbi:hypothetical protein [Streptomyces cyaneochromogenes]|uniref:hypothetical protein n=1 Tax=Streptomyces cyaneochromogenes TaxID=2496836 RepID=UPI00158C8B30|nr:hypothetical protein [Streptomyces cyaneochromogenes]